MGGSKDTGGLLTAGCIINHVALSSCYCRLSVRVDLFTSEPTHLLVYVWRFHIPDITGVPKGTFGRDAGDSQQMITSLFAKRLPSSTTLCHNQTRSQRVVAT